MRKGLFLVAAALVAGPATAQATASSPSQVADAAIDCWLAVGATGVDEAALRAKGWRAATATSRKGTPITLGMTVYGKAGTGAVLLITKQADPHSCVVTSRVAGSRTVSDAIPLLLVGFKATHPSVAVKKVSPQEVGFFALPKAALAALTGNKANPGVRIQVRYSAPEKK